MATAVRTAVISGYSGTLVIDEKRQFKADFITITGSDTTNKKYTLTVKDDGVNPSLVYTSPFFFEGTKINMLQGRIFGPDAIIEIQLFQEPPSGAVLDTITVSFDLEYVNSVLDDSYDELKSAIRVVMNGSADDISYVDDTNDGGGNSVWNTNPPTNMQEAITRLANALYHYTNNKID